MRYESTITCGFEERLSKPNCLIFLLGASSRAHSPAGGRADLAPAAPCAFGAPIVRIIGFRSNKFSDNRLQKWILLQLDYYYRTEWYCSAAPNTTAVSHWAVKGGDPPYNMPPFFERRTFAQTK